MRIAIVALVCIATSCQFVGCKNTLETTSTKSRSHASDGNAKTMQTSALQTNAKPNTLMDAMMRMISHMQTIPMNGDFDKDWANTIDIHHRGAIDLAQIEINQGKNEKMKSMAQKVIKMQTKERNDIDDIRWKPTPMKSSQPELEKFVSTLSEKMRSTKMNGDIDKDFAIMISSHYEDGIAMSNLELKNGTNRRLKQIAQKGIEERRKDINEFRQWLSANQ